MEDTMFYIVTGMERNEILDKYKDTLKNTIELCAKLTATKFRGMNGSVHSD